MLQFSANIIDILLIFIILHQSYNLILGYSGMVHVGHVGFMAVGAYTTALLTTHTSLPAFWGVIAGALGAGLIGLLLALPTVRFRDDYIVAATLGMGEIIRIFLLNERGLTGGSDGISNIPRLSFFGIEIITNVHMVPILFAITLICMLFVYRMVHSPFGKSIECIREDEVAAQAIGKKVWKKRVQMLVLGAILAGLSGALLAHHVQFIQPDTFNIDRMIMIVLVVVLGGAGTFWGPIIGSLIIVTLFEGAKFLPLPPHALGPLRWMIQAVILILIIIYRPNGIMGKTLIRKKL